MVVYIVRTKILRSNGQYFARGEVVAADEVRDIALKVASGLIVKIDTATKYGLRKVRMLEHRLGMPLMGKVRYKVAKLQEAEKTAEVTPIDLETSEDTSKESENTATTQAAALKKTFPLPVKN